MGESSHFSHAHTFPRKQEMSDLYVKAVVGRGSFGLVKLVYHKRDKRLGMKLVPEIHGGKVFTFVYIHIDR